MASGSCRSSQRQERKCHLGASGNGLLALEEEKQEEVNLTSEVPSVLFSLSKSILGEKDADKWVSVLGCPRAVLRVALEQRLEFGNGVCPEGV